MPVEKEKFGLSDLIKKNGFKQSKIVRNLDKIGYEVGQAEPRTFVACSVQSPNMSIMVAM